MTLSSCPASSGSRYARTQAKRCGWVSPSRVLAASGGRLHHRDPFAIRWHDQDCRSWRWGGQLGGLLIEGRDILPSLCDTSLDSLEAERQPQETFEDGLALPVG